jgi:hypothetical protein
MRNSGEQRTGQGKIHDESDQAVDVEIINEFTDAGEISKQQSKKDRYQGKREDGDHKFSQVYPMRLSAAGTLIM